MIVTSIVAAATLLLLAAPGTVALLELDRSAIAAGEAWRLLSGHLVHTSAGHAAWDLAALLVLGPALERRGRARFAGLLLVAAVAVSAAVLAFRPDLAVYRGLSGVATALFGALAVQLLRTPSRRALGGLALALAALKVVSEAARGEPLFAENGVGFAPVPIAHAAGLVTGVLFQLLPSILRWEPIMNLFRRSLPAAALALGLLVPASLGGDRYVAAPLETLALEGDFPSRSHRAWWTGFRSRNSLMIPRVVLDGAGEAFVGFPGETRGSDGREMLLVARIPDGGATGGRIFLARDDFSGMEEVRFRLPAAARDAADADVTYRDVAANHFEHLASSGAPGAAWFRYRANALRGLPSGKAGADDEALELDRALRELGAAIEVPAAARRPARDSELERTYGLFTGARAMAENLQLDRDLLVTGPGATTVDVDSLPGITIEEIDWTPLVEGKEPSIDPLAVRIPADQHALFFPSFPALVTLVDEAARLGTPIVRLLEEQAVDAATRSRYETQLGLELDAFARTFGPLVVRSVAVTGSDPYLRTGSDVAVLLECAEPDPLVAFLAARRTAIADARPDAAAKSGSVDGLPWSAIVTTDRSISSYVLRDGDVVLVTNSPVQLERYAAVRRGETEALGALPEFTFFRDRYARGDAAETAFFFLSDPTIRRWCSARWRIGASRRIRAQALLAHEAARAIDARTGGEAVGPALAPEVAATYGSLEFVTPIAELELDRVTEPEAEAYRRFRNGYQRNWQGFFDPIAVRIGVDDETLSTDVTVMPMIEAADAREWLEVTRGATLEPGDGDPHDDVLFHFVQAIDLRSDPVRELRSMASGMLPGVDPLAWVGDHVAFFVDDDPLFDDPLLREEPDDFLEERFDRLPFALVVDVADSVKAALFLTALRSFSDQAAPGVLTWETRTHGERPYVRVTAREDPRDDRSFSLY